MTLNVKDDNLIVLLYEKIQMDFFFSKQLEMVQIFIVLFFMGNNKFQIAIIKFFFNQPI